MLRRWLHPLELEAFAATHLRRQAWAGTGSAAAQCPLFAWDTLARLLECRGLDLLVIARGQLLDLPPPRSLAQARELLRSGIGFVVRRAERHEPELAALARCATEDLPGEAHVQLFVTPAGTHGFAWHYDAEEVFIVQTAGAKDYYLRQNTVNPTQPAAHPDFTAFRRETSALQTAQLLAGDVLYVPARWWHMAVCREDSLSISLGIAPLAARASRAQTR
jgi:50S ribosomal protein L16 3-hydroxylase